MNKPKIVIPATIACLILFCFILSAGVAYLMPGANATGASTANSPSHSAPAGSEKSGGLFKNIKNPFPSTGWSITGIEMGQGWQERVLTAMKEHPSTDGDLIDKDRTKLITKMGDCKKEVVALFEYKSHIKPLFENG
eukprot:851342_1